MDAHRSLLMQRSATRAPLAYVGASTAGAMLLLWICPRRIASSREGNYLESVPRYRHPTLLLYQGVLGVITLQTSFAFGEMLVAPVRRITILFGVLLAVLPRHDPGAADTHAFLSVSPYDWLLGSRLLLLA